MTTATSKLPSDQRATRFDPDLAAALEEELQPLSGKALTRAQQAVLAVRASGFQGTFGALLAEYREAIRKAALPRKGKT
jgi:hypothetical protein